MKKQRGLSFVTAFFLMVIILTSCLSPSTEIVITETPTARKPKTVAVVPALEEKVSYQDDFSNPESGWWLTSNDITFSKGYEAGLFQITAVKGGYIGISLFQVQPFSDFTLEIDASLKQVGALYGVAARFTREKGYYLFLVGIDGKYSIIKFDMSKTGSDRFTTLGEGSSAAIKKGLGQVNKLSVTCSGSSLSFAANGASLTTVEDSAFPIGEIGLATWVFGDGAGSRANFDNFKISSLTARTAQVAVEPQPTQKVEVAELSGIALTEVNERQYTILDSNKDGVADGASWQSQAIEVVPGLLVQKKLTLQKDKPSDPNDANYTLNWQVVFQNTTKADITVAHREYIPKTIAKSARDIKFYDSRGKERPPDKIISDDPITEWIMVIKAETIDKIIAKIPGLQSYPANPISILDGMTHAERCAWIEKHIRPHLPLAIEEAKKQGVPDWLAALVFTNELMDISAIDMIQPYIPNPGSTGIAQVNVVLAYDRKIFADHPEYQKRMAQILSNMQQDVIVRDWSKETKERTAGLYVCWEMLANPKWAVFAAAKRVRQIIDEANNNLDTPFVELLLSGKIDLNDPLKNVKTEVSLLGKSKGEELILRRQALSTLVIAAYNTDSIIGDSGATHIHNAYETLEHGENYYNAMAHARNGRDALLALMACGYFVDPKKPIPDTSAPPKVENTPAPKPTVGPTKVPVPVPTKVTTPATVDEYTRCMNMPRWQGRQSCLRFYGIATRDLSICGEIEVQEVYRGSSGFDDKDLCYKGVAEATLNIQPCNNVLNKRDKGWCREYIAVNSENPLLCELIMVEEDTWGTRDIHDRCYRSLANRLNQPSLCEKIFNGISRSYCYRSFTEK